MVKWQFFIFNKREVDHFFSFQEINKVKIIKENVEKSNQITNGIVSILNSFEHRLAKLEETILPVYNETGNLQRQQQSNYLLTILSNISLYFIRSFIHLVCLI